METQEKPQQSLENTMESGSRHHKDVLETIRKGDSFKANTEMRIPKRFWNRNLDNFECSEDMINKAMFQIMDGGSLFLTGKTGTGKTHFAIALMYQRFAYQFDHAKEWIWFLPAVEFFLELKESYNDKTEYSESDIVNKYAGADLLTIDDMGAEKISDWSRQMFFLLIDRRYRDMKQTIITSNLQLDKLSELIDDRIASRIVEMGAVIDLGDKDYRLKAQ